MRAHFDLLVLLHRVWGAFAALAAISVVLLAIGIRAVPVEAGAPEATSGALWLLGGSAAVFAAGGLGGLVAAQGLKRRRTSGRTLALVLAVPNLLVVPFGTALGVYTFWVLLNDDARREFGRPPRGPMPDARTIESAHGHVD